MLGLTSALDTARTALQDSSARSAVVSRNILGVNDPSYSKRIYQSGVSALGAQSVTARAANLALTGKALNAAGKEAFASAQSSLLSQLSTLSADPESASSLPAQFATLSADLTRLASDPSSTALAGQLISTADKLVGALRSASGEIASARDAINARVQAAAVDINDLLQQLQKTDDEIAKGPAPGRDVNELADTRDAIIGKINQYVAVRAVNTDNGRVALYSDSGLTLYDRLPRDISVIQSFDAGLGGLVANLQIDGLDATSANSSMAIRSGELAGLTSFRDGVLAPANAQIDEMARSLIGIFADTDANIPALLPDVPGLVTTDVPLGSLPSGRIVGLAGQLKLSDFANTDDAPRLLRDGGFANPLDPNYNHNSNAEPGFAGRVRQLIDRLEAPQTLNSLGKIASGVSVARYANNQGVWISSKAKAIADEKETQGATRQYAEQQLRAVTGVSLDEETARMLEVEHSYQATAKLVSTIDNMLSALMAAIN